MLIFKEILIFINQILIYNTINYVHMKLYFIIMLMQSIHFDLRKATVDFKEGFVPTASIHMIVSRSLSKF